MDTKLAQHKPSANVSMKLSRDVGDHIIYFSLFTDDWIISRLNAKAIQSEEMVSELAELYATGWGPIKMTA